MSPDPPYIASALLAAGTITVTLRAVPFAVKNALRRSALLADVGRWMPLGAIVILAVYCVTTIDTQTPDHGIPQLAALAVTVGTHLWRHNLVLSLVVGTGVCLALTNWAPLYV